MIDLETEWQRANRATGPKAYHHFSKYLQAAILEARKNPDLAPAVHEVSTGVLSQAVRFSPVAITRGKNHAIIRKLKGVVETRKRLSSAVESGDFEKAAEVVGRLWYHVLTTVPLIPQIDALAFGQNAVEDLGFVLRWAATGELPE